MGKKILLCIVVQMVNTSNEATCCCCCLNVTGFHSVVYVSAVVMLVVGYLEDQLHPIYVIW